MPLPRVYVVFCMADPSKSTAFDEPTDWLNIALMCMKELCAVCTLLLCVSRIACYDFLIAPVVLYAVLVVYGFPILNPGVYLSLRFGPNWNKSNTARTLFTLLLIPMSQVFGSFLASLIRYNLDQSYGVEVFVNYFGGQSTHLILPAQNFTGLQLISPPYAIGETPLSPSLMYILYLTEEFCAQCAFCLGVIYFCNPTDDFGEPHPVDPMSKCVEICVLFLGLAVGFPTAHLGLHKTSYLAFLSMFRGDFGYNAEYLCRAMAGLVASLVAALFYMIQNAVLNPPPGTGSDRLRKAFSRSQHLNARIPTGYSQPPAGYYQ